jgi:6-phosphogluconolactonase
MHRRDLLKTAMIAVPSLARGQSRPASFAYVGCYTTEQRHGRGDGIHVYSINGESGRLTEVQTIGDLVNPSFLITSHDRHCLYSVHGDGNHATSFRIEPSTGKLELLNTAVTGGVNGVHQALSRNGDFMVVANYGSGSVAVLPVRPTGELADQIQLVALEGNPGPHRVEQTASHPHQIVFDPTGRFVLVPDKGLDRVFIFRFDERTGRLMPTGRGSVQTREGAGPRHLAFHPTLPRVWVLNELNSTAATYSWDSDEGVLKPLQILPTLPSDFTGANSGAEIAVGPQSRFVYCSNRGHDSIAAFAVNPRTGLLTPAGWTPSGGRVPRFIGLEPSGRFLYSANEQGDSVTAFRVHSASGALTAVGPPIPNRSAVTVAFTRGI